MNIRGLRRFAQTHWTGLLAAALLLLVMFSVIRSTDFGNHWDEAGQLDRAYKSLAVTHVFLPSGFYNYPSLTYWLSIAATPLYFLHQWMSGDWPVEQYWELTRFPWYVSTRSVFAALTLLGAVPLYVAARRLSHKGAGLVALAVYLLSWQLQFHSRWIAPDSILAAVTCLFLYALTARWHAGASRLVSILPAVVAGVAASTKYQGAVLLIPALIAAVVWLQRESRSTVGPVFKALGMNILAFLAAFLIITPGALLETSEFIADIRSENSHYRTGHEGWLGATTHEHHDVVSYATASIRYLILSLPSHLALISVAACVLAMVGLVSIFRKDRLLAFTLLSAPVLLLAYYFTLVVWIARNFLIFLPFLALFTGVGVAALWGVLRGRLSRGLLVGLLLALAIPGVGVTLQGAASIVAEPNVRDSNALAARINSNLATCFRLSAGAREHVAGGGWEFPADRQLPPSGSTTVVLSDGDLRTAQSTVHLDRWPTDIVGFYDNIGSMEVDYDFYPTWAGRVRLLLMDEATRAAIGLDAAEVATLKVDEQCVRAVRN